MKIIKCDLKTYLKNYTYLLNEEIIQALEMKIENAEQLSNYLNDELNYCIWDYSLDEIEYLLDNEIQEQIQYPKYYSTYILLFNRLWETF